MDFTDLIKAGANLFLPDAFEFDLGPAPAGSMPAVYNPTIPSMPYNPMPSAPPTSMGWGFDVPGFDLVSQGGGGALDAQAAEAMMLAAACGAPFYRTAAGNEVAQPFAKVKANGKTQWFVPAAKVKFEVSSSVASVKRRKRCPR